MLSSQDSYRESRWLGRAQGEPVLGLLPYPPQSAQSLDRLPTARICHEIPRATPQYGKVFRMR